MEGHQGIRGRLSSFQSRQCEVSSLQPHQGEGIEPSPTAQHTGWVSLCHPLQVNSNWQNIKGHSSTQACCRGFLAKPKQLRAGRPQGQLQNKELRKQSQVDFQESQQFKEACQIYEVNEQQQEHPLGSDY